MESPKIRITTIKALSNNQKTILSRTVIILPKLEQEFSKFQIQTATVMMQTISKMLAIGREEKEGADNAEVEAAASNGQEIYELKIHELRMALRNPLQSRKAQKMFLTTAVIKGIVIRNFVEQAFNWKPLSKDSLRQAYLDDRQEWVNRINHVYTRRKPPSAFRKRMRQSITFVTVKSLDLSASPSASSETKANEGLSAQPITLLANNFKKYGLPADTPLCNIVHTTYYVVKEEDSAARIKQVEQLKDKSTSRPQTPRDRLKSDHAAQTPRTPSREQARFLPPGNLFIRVNPLVLQLNQAALMQPVNLKLLDLGRAPYVLYGVKYIDLVSLEPASQSKILSSRPLFFKIAQNLDLRCVSAPAPWVLGPKHVSNPE